MRSCRLLSCTSMSEYASFTRWRSVTRRLYAPITSTASRTRTTMTMIGSKIPSVRIVTAHARGGMLREPLAIGVAEAKPPLVLSLDIGTSGVRAFVFDRRARLLRECIVHIDHAVRTSRDGEATLDAAALARSVFIAIDASIRGARRRAGDIAAVGISAFWHSLLG